MLNSAKEFLQSYPAKVYFAGWESTTLGLSENGWDISINESYSPTSAQKLLYLGLRHEGAGLYAVSERLDIDLRDIYVMLEDPYHSKIVLSLLQFNIIAMASNVRFREIPIARVGMSFAAGFLPIDPRPRMEKITDMSEFRFFRALSPNVKDIIVDPKQVPDLLELILKCQLSEQEQIKRREVSRANYEKYGSLIDAKVIAPPALTQASIITLP